MIRKVEGKLTVHVEDPIFCLRHFFLQISFKFFNIVLGSIELILVRRELCSIEKHLLLRRSHHLVVCQVDLLFIGLKRNLARFFRISVNECRV